MILSDLIDQKISKIRFNYTYDNGHGMQEVQSQIKLSNGEIILMPNYPDNEYDLLEDYKKNVKASFQKAKRCALASRLLFKNRRIVDIHFEYLDNEPSKDSRGIFELDNGKFITENNSGPQGLSKSDLIVMNKSQFQDLSNDGLAYRSLRNDILGT